MKSILSSSFNPRPSVVCRPSSVVWYSYPDAVEHHGGLGARFRAAGGIRRSADPGAAGDDADARPAAGDGVSVVHVGAVVAGRLAVILRNISLRRPGLNELGTSATRHGMRVREIVVRAPGIAGMVVTGIAHAVAVPGVADVDAVRMRGERVGLR